MKSIIVPANVSQIPIVVDFVNNFLLTKKILDFNKVDIVIDEVFCNIASYAYDCNKKSVCVFCGYDEKNCEFKLIFVDEGKPYNPLTQEDPDITLSTQDRQIGGLGIFIVKNLMDKVLYDFKDGKNFLTLVKILKSKEEDDDMNIKKKQDGEKVILKLEGRLDTNTSSELEKEIGELFENNQNKMVLDLKDLAYVSSAGLRVLLSAQKKINQTSGEMIIENPNPDIMEIFEVTGFVDVLKIQKQ